ncbi:WD40/YVTN/BNR-like repeat-containing protein [Pseudoalteromonas sp. H105]|uniref:WD40/YVTN/BNR-like repeat-containing protein n=1 Tax=Pseudoalteromonas sp. H105 TaxID=1348393 RepID=UPI0007322D08|nr:YCF48-related protein [Pseudoalteromonas sp. H105]KTF18326.1 hypothetical protein ATS75_02640 [Pseudoalteromonas sp. H105]
MKYLLYAGLTTLAFLSSVVPAAPQPAISAPKAQKTLLTDIEYNGEKLVAVGKHGTIITSTDAVKWDQAIVPTQILLTAVNFINEQTGWACGHDATIIHSTNGGANWQLQHVNEQLDKPCLDIMFTDNQTGYAVGAYGMFYETNDGGKQWNKRFLESLLHEDDRDYLDDLKETDPEGYEIETSSILPHFNRIVAAGDELIIVGEMGLMARSPDKGKTWHREDEIYPGSFFSYAQDEKGQALVAGLRGNIFTRTGTEPWLHIKNKKTATVNSILNMGNQSWLLLANSGVIFHYKNKQLTVEQLPNGKSILDAVIFEDNLIMASEDGIKIKGITP